jgi:ubiquinone/menaquinone biosynthesis C-methylase UbiE
MPLTAERARAAYDRIGRLQDTQAFYERAATCRLAEFGGFDQARSVLELGCGTGRFGARLLRHRLPSTARYRGVEISPKMASLARRRLARWAPRAEVVLIDPPGRVLPGIDGQFDRFVACYVLDLLTFAYAGTVLAEASRLLGPGGLLCLVSLTHGVNRTGRVVSESWETIFERREVLTRWGVPSELVVASSARRVADA